VTKKFKEKKSVMFLKLFQNAMIRNIKIHNILDIIDISKSMEPTKYIQKMFNECFKETVFYDLSKFDGFRKMKVTFLVVPPEDKVAQPLNTT
jgi:hypothetical protein